MALKQTDMAIQYQTMAYDIAGLRAMVLSNARSLHINDLYHDHVMSAQRNEPFFLAPHKQLDVIITAEEDEDDSDVQSQDIDDESPPAKKIWYRAKLVYLTKRVGQERRHDIRYDYYETEEERESVVEALESLLLETAMSLREKEKERREIMLDLRNQGMELATEFQDD